MKSSFFTLNSDTNRLRISKAILYYILLFLVILVSYRVLLTSILYYVEIVLELAFEVFIVIYLGYRVTLRIFNKNYRLNTLEVYFGLLFFLPIIPAVAALNEFGQPLFYGLGTFRDFYLLFFSLVIYNMLRRGEISIELLERAFVGVALFNMAFSYFLSLAVDPSAFQESNLAGSNDAKGGEVYFRFNMAMFFFGSTYFFVKAFYRKNYIYFGYSALFLIYVVFFRLDRTSMAVNAAAIVAFFFTAVSARTQLLTLFKLIIPLIMGLIVAYFIVPEIFEQYIDMFADAISSATGSGVESEEDTIRLVEAQVAIDGIKEHPFLGNGKISNEWEPLGYNRFYPYFFASDVGILGQTFMYGIIGATILYGQFILALYFILRIKHIKRNVFLVSLKFYLLALALDALTNGYITIYAAQSVMVLAVIYYFYQKDKQIGIQLKLDRHRAAIENSKMNDLNE
jgi:hypothetical protein